VLGWLTDKAPTPGRHHRVGAGLCIGLLLSFGASLAAADPAGDASVPSARYLSETSQLSAPQSSASQTRSGRPAISLPTVPSGPLSGQPFGGLPQVGAIFSTSNGSPTGHYCSGSVVDSPTGDIVVTAAHCVADTTGYVSNIAFVPDYHDNQNPYGVWPVTNIVVSPQWLNDTDPDYDVAFLTVHRPGSAARIQDVVGADKLGIDAGYTNLVQVVAYHTDTEEPVTCNNYTSQFTDPSLTSPQLEFDCGNYPTGTSGAPFLTDVDSNTDLGTVIGVIGGYKTGGSTPSVSYSIHFDGSVARLLAAAEAQS
jgi:V8-like Glu-specific endopeptidase